jgi:putative flippase GtrA
MTFNCAPVLPGAAPSRTIRWLRFNCVGLIGVGMQLVVLAALVYGLGLHYAIATPLAVELTILHNFMWHEHWTWRENRKHSCLKTLFAFNLSSGSVSLIGNMLLTPVLVEAAGLNVIAANLLAIVACSLANFFLADCLVFRSWTGSLSRRARQADSVAKWHGRRDNAHLSEDRCSYRSVDGRDGARSQSATTGLQGRSAGFGELP